MFWFIPLVAFFAALLTFFSGFGLGTLLLAALIWYYPPEIAIGITAIVHLLSSIVKSSFNRDINWSIAFYFGISSIFFAVLGSILLTELSNYPTYVYDLTETTFTRPVSLLSFLIGIIMLVFSFIEVLLKGKSLRLPLWVGGAMSGFMGGLSGHQGALRSVFLMKEVKEVNQFVSTGALIGLATDLVRNAVYLNTIQWEEIDLTLLLLTAMAAILGVLVGTMALSKVNIRAIQVLVSFGMALLGTAMMLGFI